MVEESALAAPHGPIISNKRLHFTLHTCQTINRSHSKCQRCCFNLLLEVFTSSLSRISRFLRSQTVITPWCLILLLGNKHFKTQGNLLLFRPLMLMRQRHIRGGWGGGWPAASWLNGFYRHRFAVTWFYWFVLVQNSVKKKQNFCEECLIEWGRRGSERRLLLASRGQCRPFCVSAFARST